MSPGLRGVVKISHTTVNGILLIKAFSSTCSWAQKLWVIEEVPQEPAQLPHRFLRAVEPTHDGMPGQSPGLKDRNALLCQLNSYAHPKQEVVA